VLVRSVILNFIAKFILAAVILFITAGLIIYHFVQADDWKRYVTSLVKQQTGLNLSIEGELSGSLFPALEIALSRVSLSRSNHQPIFRAERARLRADLENVLQPRTILQALEFENMEVFIEKGVDGKFNFSPSQTTAQKKVVSGKTNPAAFSLPISSISINNGHVRYVDRVLERDIKLEKLFVQLKQSAEHIHLEVNIGNIQSDRLNIEAFSYQGKLTQSQPVRLFDTMLDASVSYNQQVMDLQVRIPSLRIGNGRIASSKPLKVLSKKLELDVDLQVDVSSNSKSLELDFSGFNPSSLLPFPELERDEGATVLQHLAGQIKLNQQNHGTAIQLNGLQLDETQIQGEIEWQDDHLLVQIKADEITLLPYLLGLKPVIGINESASDSNTIRSFKTALTVNRLNLPSGYFENINQRLVFQDNQAQQFLLSFKATNLKPQQDIRYFQDRSSLKLPMLERLNPGDFNHLSGGLVLEYEQNHISIELDKLRMDDTEVDGQLTYQLEPESIRTDLEVGEINLDRYQYLFQLKDDARSEGGDLDTILSHLQRLQRLKGDGNIWRLLQDFNNAMTVKS
jgi:uncharacterized protein involved in outer membrane biogenesis